MCATQREAIVNIFRACVGLPAENHMLLENRLKSASTSVEPMLAAYEVSRIYAVYMRKAQC